MYFGYNLGDGNEMWVPQMCCITCLRLLTMAKLSRHILFAVRMILKEPEVPFNGLLFLLNKYVTLGITARSKITAKYPDLSSAIWHVSLTKFHRVKFASTKFTGYVKCRS
jgi:hypothetical protein